MYDKVVDIGNKVVSCRFSDNDYKALYFRASKLNLTIGQYVKVVMQSKIHKSKIEDELK